jgi:DNA polymerase-3 subunit epsilon
MSHRKPKDQRASIKWARKVFSNKHKYIILDTETTGLTNDDEIIQLAIIDMDGNSLFNELIKPSNNESISKKALRIHGISMLKLKDSPTFKEIAKTLRSITKGKILIAYNAAFDSRVYAQSYQFSGGFNPWGMKRKWECAMLEYARFTGEWNEYHNDYKWQKLAGGDHSAIGDSLATLELIRAMANSKLQKEWFEFWVSNDANQNFF